MAFLSQGHEAPAARASGALALYRRLPEEVRRCLRPLNLLDECASFLPARLRAPSVTATEMARRLFRLRRVRYALRRFEGPARCEGRPLVCLVAADELSSRYWMRTFYEVPPAEQTIGLVPALEVRATAARLARGADLSLWQVSWPMSRFAREHAVVPASVPFWLATDRSLDEVFAGDVNARGSRKEEVRRARRLGLSVRVTTDARDYERFRRELYVPYGRSRFADLFAEVPAHAFRHARRQGCLLLLEDGGRTLAGAVLERWSGDVRVLAFGVESDGAARPQALLAACYYHVIEYAVEAGLARVSLGTTRPVLSDGVLRYKRKWGAAVGAPNTWDAFLLHYRNTPAVRAALAAAPLVLDRGAGRLAALVGGAGPDVSEQLAWTDTPGLSEVAYLADGAPPATLASLHAAVRVVGPGEVWPPAADAAVNAP